MKRGQCRSLFGRGVLTAIGFVFIVAIPARAQYTANYQTNTISGVASNWAANYLVGSNTFADVLLIQNSGILTNLQGYLGYESSSWNNRALVTGTGSIWHNWFELHLGWNGAGNNLVVSNGGRVVANSAGSMGYYAGSSNNSVLVSGTGSLWSNQFMFVGHSSASNSVVVNNSGQVINNLNVFVGYDSSSSNNSVLVTGSGSVWSNGSGVSVGNSGAGNSLVISNGGRMINGTGSSYVGNLSSSNRVLIAGSGSAWNTRTNLCIGYNGSFNSLVVSNGGQLVSSNAYVGFTFPGISNSVLITGAGSVWSNRADLHIGGLGFTNSLVISDGGRVVSDSGIVGNSLSVGNSVLVTGPGSVWSNRYQLYVGRYALRTSLIISNGAQVINADTSLGVYTTSSNNIVRVVDGATWRNDTLRIGDQGSSNSLIVAGGSVATTNVVVGFASAVCNNLVQLDSGSVIVTNATGGAVFEVRRGKLVLNGGLLQVDRFVMTNACAQFVRTGGTFIYGTAVLTPTRDDDGDGMLNGWEQAYGLDPLNPADANADPDGDGFTNLQEFQAGTDPTNNTSSFRITSLVATDQDVLVTWMMGSGKTNALEAAAGGLEGSFTNTFTDIFTVTNTVGTETNYLDAGAATNVPSRYYRIRLVP